MLEALAKLKTTEDIENQLSRNAPAWMGELSAIFDDVKQALPGITKRGFRTV